MFPSVCLNCKHNVTVADNERVYSSKCRWLPVHVDIDAPQLHDCGQFVISDKPPYWVDEEQKDDSGKEEEDAAG